MDISYCKINHLFTYKGNAHWRISPFADGNCGLYAFTCGLIDNIISDKLTLDDEKFAVLIDFIRKTNKFPKKKLFLNEHITSEISIFLEYIYEPNLTFSTFKNFLIKHPPNRNGIIALNLIFSDALRIIGIRKYLEKLGMVNAPLMDEDKKLHDNGTWVGQDILVSLADYFGIYIRLLVTNSLTESNCYDASLLADPNQNFPSFSLLLENSHWCYLIPVEQKDGLASTLPCTNQIPWMYKIPATNKKRHTFVATLQLPEKAKNDKNKFHRLIWMVIYFFIDILKSIYNFFQSFMTKKSKKQSAAWTDEEVQIIDKDECLNKKLVPSDYILRVTRPLKLKNHKNTEISNFFKGLSTSLPALNKLNNCNLDNETHNRLITGGGLNSAVPWIPC